MNYTTDFFYFVEIFNKYLMAENLVIVESPAKARTIERFLGKEYLVKSCFGHIRDLVKKNLGVDIDNNYEPVYEISPDKKKVVSELKKISKDANRILLASDEDREGEAIAWHLVETLKLNQKETKRIVFHEITKDAILNAIKTPRDINKNLVYAQVARRVLDRLVGFELSPILWKKIKPALSAGRVQSVAVRLIVERERDIHSFESTSSYKLNALFNVLNGNDKTEIKAEIPSKFKSKEETLAFLRSCADAEFEITNIEVKPTRKSPAPPFTTSTLQQEASRKLGFSVAQTMAIAQRLYESGKITYMRTDSVNLSNAAIYSAKKEISDGFGENYIKIRKYKTKTPGAQEAHEAIRPTYLNNHNISGSREEERLYELIWKRTIASQMSDAEFEKTTATISISGIDECFIATGEVVKFDGFLKVYIESADDDNDTKEYGSKDILPPVKINQKLFPQLIKATQRFSAHQPRYTEASLVKKLEELGIGRPSTYAPIISTIQAREYAIKEDRSGTERQYELITLADKQINEETKTEMTGVEKSKLFPTDIGIVVNDFLVEHFQDIMNYNFTASVEKEFDDIALGNTTWNDMIDKFYKSFHIKVENTLKTTERAKGERILGNDPKTGKQISVKIGRYGPIAQLGKSDEDEKPRFASLLKGQHLETITLEEALELFELPRVLGKYEGEDVIASIGKFGPYLRHKSNFYSLKNPNEGPLTIKLERAIEIIKEKIIKERNKIIKEFAENSDIKIMKGRWGPYLHYKNNNYKIPKYLKPEDLSVDDCMDIVKKAPDKQ